MSMKATEAEVMARATPRATVDFPEPDPPAMPMTSGFTGGCGRDRTENVAEIVTNAKALGLSRFRIGAPNARSPRNDSAAAAAEAPNWKRARRPDSFRG